MNNISNTGGTRNPMLKVLFQLFDFLIIFMLLVAITVIYPDASWSIQYSLLGLSGVIVFLFASEVGGIYQSWRGVSYQAECLRVCIFWFCSILSLLVLAYVTKTSAEYSRIVVGSWFVAVPVLLCFWRGMLRLFLSAYRARGYNSRRVAVLGANEIGTQLADTIRNSPWLGLEFIGFFDDRAVSDNRRSWEGEVEGSIATLISEAHAGNIDIIYITLPLTAQPRIIIVIDKLADTTTSVFLAPDFFVFSLFHGKWTNLAGIPIVSVFDTPFLGVDGWLKRIQDVVLATIILAIIAIPMILVAFVVKISSPGPVFFKQRRYGIEGQEIYVWKFRTMRVQEDGDVVKQATRNDPRVTPVGSFLRRSSLDELPQFFNVLQGSMSIVGPRPHAVAHNEEYRPLIKGYMLRHAVKPGITGWAQVNGWRGETRTLDKMEKRIEYDLWYIRNWSFWLDMRIILLTVVRGFYDKSAY
ncbi:MAG: undecaprenyl-phosphate glucose phosphotransferase [Methylococcales bacterium]